MGPQAILITQLAEKQYSKQNQNTALGLWFPNFSVQAPFILLRLRTPGSFYLWGLHLSIYTVLEM